MDFKRVCRICLECSDQTYDIFTSYYAKGNRLYSDMLSDCTKLKPQQEDGLPRLICKTCSRQLKRTFLFNLLCEESYKKLKCYQEVTQNYFDSSHKNLKLETFNEEKKIDYSTDGRCIASIVENGEQFHKDQALKQDIINGKQLNGNKFLVTVAESGERFQQDVKQEPGYADNDDDSCWDAEDDNLLLGQIKLNKSFEELGVGSIKSKKKKGRKKKEPEFCPEDNQTPASKLPHQCDVCGKILSTKSNMKAHKICHTDQRPYPCPICPATFRGHSALFQHRKMHTGETPYHCTFCPKQFSRRTGLVNHIRMHTGEKQYSCEICLKEFVQSAQLSIHMKRHKGDKSFLCQECGKGFPIKADLQVHQRIHNGEKPYSCHMCTKTFATSGNLSIHIRIHNKEVRYNCNECSRGFVTRSAFSVHVKRHKGQRDYACECGKTFYTSSALKQHRVVHTGEKRYQCKICDRKFSQTSHLSRHFKRDHAKPNAPVPPSDHFKLVLTNSSEMFATTHTQPLKCEAS